MVEKRTALITGGSGYLGSHVSKLLHENGWSIIIVDKRPPDHFYYDQLFVDDILNTELVREIFVANKVDVVFHFAGKIEVAESEIEPKKYYSNNVQGTLSILNAMRGSCDKIIFSSTGGLYASSDKPLTEDSHVDPKNVYAISKLCSEQLIKSSNNKYVIFRYFNLAGADESGEIGENHTPETHLIPRILQNLNNFEIYGSTYDTPDGTCIRDYVHVCDVANVHIDAANYLLNGNVSDTINLGLGQGYSIKQIINLVEDVTKQKVNYTVRNKREGDPPRLVADISKARNVLKFTPKYEIKHIIETAYRWESRRGGN